MKEVLKNKRNYNLDLLRILACFMVIVIHVAAYRWYDVPYYIFDFKVYNFYDSLVRSAVPLFVMISGVFFLKESKTKDIKKIYLKNILKLIIIYFLGSLLYCIYDVIVKGTTFSIGNFINAPFHFWYIPMIIGLYVVSPLLSIIANNSSRKIFKYFSILFIICSTLKTISNISFMPYINHINTLINKLPIDLICGFYSYFLLGYFLYNFEISRKKEKLIYFLGIISVFGCAILTYITSKYNGSNTTAFYNEFSIFTFFEAISLFLYFKNFKSKYMEKYKDKIFTIADCTLGIYILHVLVMYGLFDLNIIKITTFNPIISVPLISVIILLICLIIVYIYKKYILKFKN